MKRFLALVSLLTAMAVPALSQVQGPAMRSTNGISFGITTIGGRLLATNTASTNHIVGTLNVRSNIASQGIIHGNAFGVSNAVTLIASNCVTIIANADGRTFTITGTGSGQDFLTNNRTIAVNLTNAANVFAGDGIGLTRIGGKRGFFNVKDYGAVGDGVTDDRVAIQAATSAAAATNGTVYFPNPSVSYRVGTAETPSYKIEVTNNVTFIGDSRIRTKIKFAPETPTTAHVLFRVWDNSNVIFEDLNLEGPDDNNDQTCRGIGWQDVTNTGSITLRRVNSTKLTTVVKMQSSATLDSCVLTVDECDLFNANTGTNPFVVIESIGAGQVFGSVVKISRSKLRAGGNSYCLYRSWGTSLSLQDCDIGPGDSRSTTDYLIYAEGGPLVAPTFDLVSNCRFNSSNVQTAALKTNKRAVELVSNCSFKGGRGLALRGSAQIDNCIFDGVDMHVRDDILSNSVVLFNNCRFLDTTFSAMLELSDPIRFEFQGCTFQSVTNTAHLAQLRNAGLTASFDDCTFAGGTNYQVRIDFGDKLQFTDCKFYNSSATSAIWIPTPADVLDIRVQECWFEDSTKAYTISSDSYVRRELGNRSGMKEGAIASVNELTLDWNYDTFRITGVTTINRIAMQGVAWSGQPQTSFNGKATLIVEGEFSLGTNGNILPASLSTRTVGTAITLTYNGDVLKWVEMASPLISPIQGDFAVGTNLIVTQLKTTIQNGSANTFVVTNGNIGLGKTNPETMLHINSAAAPSAGQAKITANSLGSLSFFNYGADNNAVGFDVDYSTGAWRARHAAVAWIYKAGSKLTTYGSIGNTLGATATQTVLTTLDLSSGNFGIGLAAPTNKLQVVGAIQSTTTVFSDSASLTNGILWQGGAQLTNIYTATATLDFDLTAVVVEDLTMTVTGSAVGDVVSLGVPNGSVTTTVIYNGWVSAANTVTVRARIAVSGENPASGVFRAEVRKWK